MQADWLSEPAQIQHAHIYLLYRGGIHCVVSYGSQARSARSYDTIAFSYRAFALETLGQQTNTGAHNEAITNPRSRQIPARRSIATARLSVVAEYCGAAHSLQIFLATPALC